MSFYLLMSVSFKTILHRFKITKVTKATVLVLALIMLRLCISCDIDIDMI